MGSLHFIKGFDWIIDFRNNKVFVKKNHINIDKSNSKKITYKVKESSNRLFVTFKEKSLTKYSLGDEIVSVNDKKINDSNICEMQELMNKAEDWDTLNFEIIPVKK